MSQSPQMPELAVALRYEGSVAPKVTAKGKCAIAKSILAKAQEHHIPLKSDPALANLLASIPLGDEIPRELYMAVAEVLAFAFLLSEKQGYSQRPE